MIIPRKESIIYGDVGKMNTAIQQADDLEYRRNRKTIVRPAIVSAGETAEDTYILFEGYAEIDIDNPSTIKSTGAAGGSNTTFVSRSLADATPGSKKKIIVKLNDTVPIWSAVAEPPILHLARVTGSSYVTADVNHSGLTPTQQIQFWLKVTPIVADFDIDAQTWNNYSSLTLASDSSTVIIAQAGMLTGTFITNGVYTIYPASINGGILNCHLNHSLSFGSAGTLIYGFVIQVQPDYVHYSVLNSIEGILTIRSDGAVLSPGQGVNALILNTF